MRIQSAGQETAQGKRGRKGYFLRRPAACIFPQADGGRLVQQPGQAPDMPVRDVRSRLGLQHLLLRMLQAIRNREKGRRRPCRHLRRLAVQRDFDGGHKHLIGLPGQCHQAQRRPIIPAPAQLPAGHGSVGCSKLNGRLVSFLRVQIGSDRIHKGGQTPVSPRDRLGLRPMRAKQPTAHSHHPGKGSAGQHEQGSKRQGVKIVRQTRSDREGQDEEHGRRSGHLKCAEAEYGKGTDQAKQQHHQPRGCRRERPKTKGKRQAQGHTGQLNRPLPIRFAAHVQESKASDRGAQPVIKMSGQRADQCRHACRNGRADPPEPLQRHPPDA